MEGTWHPRKQHLNGQCHEGHFRTGYIVDVGCHEDPFRNDVDCNTFDDANFGVDDRNMRLAFTLDGVNLFS